jgi:hypothetical protein
MDLKYIDIKVAALETKKQISSYEKVVSILETDNEIRIVN